jgi:hypothetical protein
MKFFLPAGSEDENNGFLALIKSGLATLENS